DRYRTGQHSTNDVHTSLEKKNNYDLVNHQQFRLVSSTKVKIDLVIVFIYKDPFSSGLSHGKKVVNGYFSSTKLTLQLMLTFNHSSLTSPLNQLILMFNSPSLSLSLSPSLSPPSLSPPL